jgi:hypothetical protein
VAIDDASRYPQLIDSPALVTPSPNSPRPNDQEYGFSGKGLRKFRDAPANSLEETLATLFDSAMEVVYNVQRGAVWGAGLLPRRPTRDFFDYVNLQNLRGRWPRSRCRP